MHPNPQTYPKPTPYLFQAYPKPTQVYDHPWDSTSLCFLKFAELSSRQFSQLSRTAASNPGWPVWQLFRTSLAACSMVDSVPVLSSACDCQYRAWFWKPCCLSVAKDIPADGVPIGRYSSSFRPCFSPAQCFPSWRHIDHYYMKILDLELGNNLQGTEQQHVMNYGFSPLHPEGIWFTLTFSLIWVQKEKKLSGLDSYWAEDIRFSDSVK